MAAMHLSDDDLVGKLSAHPHLRDRVESLLLAVGDEAGDLKEADAAEMLVIEEMRRMGQEALQAWAACQVDKTSKEFSQTGGAAWREGKKNCAGTQRLATSE
jgi:membrane-bound ClpP family serine protease